MAMAQFAVRFNVSAMMLLTLLAAANSELMNSTSVSLRGSASERILKGWEPYLFKPANRSCKTQKFAGDIGSKACTKLTYNELARDWCAAQNRGFARTYRPLVGKQADLAWIDGVAKSSGQPNADRVMGKTFSGSVFKSQPQDLKTFLTCSDDCKCLESLSCSGDFVPTEEDTANAFVFAVSDEKLRHRITDNWNYMKQAVEDACIGDAKEFSMFVANVIHESDKLSAKAEYRSNFDDDSYDWAGCERGWGDNSPTCSGEGCWKKCYLHFFGRGYLQTTWHANYKAARDLGGCTVNDKGEEVDILKDPYEVSKSERLAWCTAAYFWRTSVHNDRCTTLGKDTISEKLSCDMGNTIHAINNMECKNSEKKAHAQKRFCYYRRFYEKYTKNKEVVDWADSVCVEGLDASCPVKTPSSDEACKC